MSEGFRFTSDRRGIVYRGQTYSGFPYIDAMSDEEKLRVARLADRVNPDSVSSEQRALLRNQPMPAVSESRLEGERQDRILSSPLVRAIWDSLSEHEKVLVHNPSAVTGAHYPLTTGQLVHLTGLTRRMAQYWSDREVLPHWTDERGFRFFETPAVIIAFALRGTQQAERQFYGDIGTDAKPFGKMPAMVSMIGVRMLATSDKASTDELERTEHALRAVADSIAELRVRS